MYQHALNPRGVRQRTSKVTYTQQTRGGALHCESPVFHIDYKYECLNDTANFHLNTSLYGRDGGGEITPTGWDKAQKTRIFEG